MKQKDTLQKTKEELFEMLEAKRGELQTYLYEINTGKAKDTTKRRKLRKEIARILTILNSKK